ncbi:MAG: hypothetical protein CL878_08255 [Dehalococcoidia bacterium]|nr:hypothetical protein [Dehalococcoidia bacterium]
MRVTGSGLVYDAGEGPSHGRVCAHTTISLLSDGSVLVGFRRGSARDSLDGHVCVFASADQGTTWELRYDGFGHGTWDDTPGEVKCIAIAELTPGVLTGTSLWVDRSRPELPWISPQTQGLLPMRICHTTSTDGGRSWVSRREVATAPHVAASPCSSSVLTLAGGALAQPYEHWKAYDDQTPGHPGARLRLSSDAGDTWPEYVTVAVHPEASLYYWDQRLSRHPDTGQLVAMFWTHDATTGKDRDIHIAWGTPDGRTWSQPVGTGLPGQHCQPLSVGGDRLLAIYAHRRQPPGIRAAISQDFGKTWDRTQELAVYASSAGTESGAEAARDQDELWQDMLAWRFGHPRAVALPGGDILVAFYAGNDDAISVPWARLTL